jgi:hypothetical protein
MKIPFPVSCAVALLVALGGTAQAASYTNISGIVVEIDEGDLAFADAVVSFNPGLVPDPDYLGQNVPFTPFLQASEALGIPDLTATAAQNCAAGAFADGNELPPFVFDKPQLWADCNFVSLGVGPTVTNAGSLVVRFTDNVLRGSGDSNFDLWIFETGPDIEDTFVDISTDGTSWQSVGKVGGSTSGVDIDAFGFGVDDIFTYVRLIDDGLEGDGSPGASNVGETVGADIDAIAAGRISVVPAPPAAWLALTALLALGGRVRRR